MTMRSFQILIVVFYFLLLLSGEKLSSALTTTTTTTSSVHVWFDSTNKYHRDIYYHPEQPARIDSCIRALDSKENVKLMDISPEPPAINSTNSTTDSSIEHTPFSEAELEHARNMLLKVHSEEFVTNLESRCRNSRQRRLDESKNALGFVGYVDDDTFVTTETYDICLRATAAWIRAVDHARTSGPSSATTTLSAGFALTRPPGHHATSDLSNGFCLFNFAAAAAVHALESHASMKISIFDWDVHYGQGVADIIQNHDRVRYASIHQSPAFPNMGTKLQILGKYNNILTVPIPPDTSWTCGYKEKFETKVIPFLFGSDKDEGEESWEPDLLIVCAGYDALDSDELANVSLCARDYAEMTKQLVQNLRSGGTITNQKTASIAMGLEGGYQLSEFSGASGNLADAVEATVHALASSYG